MILSSQSVQAAPPLCAQILMSSQISESSIQITIDRIAELKMDLDLAQAHGDTTTLHRLFDLEYDKKINSLRESLRGKISEHELHEMISAKIHSLQKDLERNTKIQTQAREELHDIIAPYSYSSKIDLNTRGAATSLTYLGSRNSVVFTDSKNRQLMIVDLASGQVQPLLKDVMKYFVLDNENSLLVLSSKGELSRLNLNNNEFKSVTSSLVQTHHLQDINTTERVFATADNTDNKLVLIDLTNGKLLPIQVSLPEPSKAISTLKFINDHELLLSRFMEHFFYKIDINKGTFEIIDAGPQVIEGIHVSPDRQNLIFHSRSGLISIKAAELLDLKNRTSQQVGKSISNLSFMPDGEKLFIIYNQGTLQRSIFGSEVINDAYFSFPDSMNLIDPMIITVPAFDGKGHRIFFPNVTKDPDGIKQYHIEVWQQEP